jgi:hypothetical protein
MTLLCSTHCQLNLQFKTMSAEHHINKKGPFYEYSVVYTDRVYNLMSPVFQEAMQTISTELKACYNAAGVVVIPGSGMKYAY